MLKVQNHHHFREFMIISILLCVTDQSLSPSAPSQIVGPSKAATELLLEFTWPILGGSSKGED